MLTSRHVVTAIVVAGMTTLSACRAPEDQTPGELGLGGRLALPDPARAMLPPIADLSALLGLFQRGGNGPFAIAVATPGPFVPTMTWFPSSVWSCVATPATAGAATLVLAGCTAPGLDGDFDLELSWTTAGSSLELHTSLTSRLTLGIALLRVILRLPSALLPAGADSHLLFGLDEWVDDPIAQLVAGNVDHDEVLTTWRSDLDDPTRGFYFDTQSRRPMLAFVRPGLGWMLHDTDPDSAASGRWFVGSNDGALELGYELHLPGELLPGNGFGAAPTALSPTLRATPLPAQVPAAQGWWEAAQAYRAYIASVGLLPAVNQLGRSVPAAWARDCLHTVLNLGADVDGTVPGPSDEPAVVDVQHQVDFLRAQIEFHKAGGQLRYCPMLWGWSAVGPYQPISGVRELLAAWSQLAIDEGVEIHPWIYMHSQMVGAAALASSIAPAILHDASGAPFSWGSGLYNVRADHPAFVAAILDGLKQMMPLGIHGVYFDEPFVDPGPSAELGGIDPNTGRATRHLLDQVSAVLSPEGGEMACELQRLGLAASYGGSLRTTLPGAAVVPVTEALVHDYELTSAFGDLAAAAYEYLAADPQMYPVPPGAETSPGAAIDMHRLAIDAAVMGRSGVDADYFQHVDDPSAVNAALGAFDALSLRNAFRARRQAEALQTGRLLYPPTSDSPIHDVATRRMIYGTPTFSGHLTHNPAPLYPSSLFASIARPGRYALTAGNPTASTATVTLTIDRSRYAELVKGSFVLVRRDADGTEHSMPLPRSALWTIPVSVPPLDLVTVELVAR